MGSSFEGCQQDINDGLFDGVGICVCLHVCILAIRDRSVCNPRRSNNKIKCHGSGHGEIVRAKLSTP